MIAEVKPENVMVDGKLMSVEDGQNVYHNNESNKMYVKFLHIAIRNIM